MSNDNRQAESRQLTPAECKEVASSTFRDICAMAHRCQLISQDLRLNPEIFPGQQDLGRDLGRASLLLHGIVNGMPWEYTSLEKNQPKRQQPELNLVVTNEEEEKTTDEERKARLGHAPKD